MAICKTQGSKSTTTCNSDVETTLFSFEELRTFRLANDQISVPFATQRTPNFRNETTTFLEKGPPYLSLPKRDLRRLRSKCGQRIRKRNRHRAPLS